MASVQPSSVDQAEPGQSVAILAPHGRDAAVGKQLLEANGYAAFILPSLDALTRRIAEPLGAVLIAEEALAGDALPKLEQHLQAQPAWSDLPFIVLANGLRSLRSQREADRLDAAGNVVLLSRPLNSEDLLRAVKSALKARQRQYEARERLQELEEQGVRLRASEAHFHAIVSSVDQMIWSTLPDGFHDFYNQRWYDYTGVPRGSTDGEGWNDMFHPDDQERAWARWRHSLTTGEPYHIEYRLRHRSGEYRWVLGKAQPVRGANGAITRWYGTCTEIHDQVLARHTLARSREELERAVRERTAELSAVQQERDRIWEASVDLLAVVRPDATVADVNPVWRTLLGYEPDDLIGRNFLDLTHPDDVEETRAEFALIFERPLVEPYVFRFRHKDGSYREFAWTASAHGGLAYPAGRDVTEQHAQAKALREAEHALRQSQKLETIGQLTGGVAHDFNNLLMAIRSSLDLLQRRLPAGEARLSELVANAQKATERGASLTQRMLAFARKQELDTQAVDLTELLAGMRDLIERSIGPQVRVSVEVAAEAGHALVDANQLEMALLNLAVNARDAMDGAGELVIGVDHVEVAESGDLAPGRYVRIAVRDSGAGMDAATLAQALEPFFTTKGIGKGTGLGLSMVHGLARQSGGTFELESAPGKGTVARILLPAAQQEPVASAPPKKPSLAAVGPVGLRILAVDDDALVLFGTVALLEDLGHTVFEACSGADALDLLADLGGVDLVITDQAMPKMTGVEMARALHGDFPDIPVILASGYSEMPEGAGEHIVARLEKPFNEDALVKAVERAMGQAALSG